MKKFAIFLCGVLGLLVLAHGTKADGPLGYGGQQPWWNIFAKRTKLNPEEERLQRFWHDYYDSMGRYYQTLDKIDWVAYYKNHGYQINTGGGAGCCPGGSGPSGGPNRIQFAPVIMTPGMAFAVPNSAAGPPTGPSSPPPGVFTPGYGSFGPSGGPMPPPGYGGPPGMGGPPPGYGGGPPPGYGGGGPPPGYGGGPPPGYGGPPPGYGGPPPGYGGPPPGYGGPPPGYGGPPPGYGFNTNYNPSFNGGYNPAYANMGGFGGDAQVTQANYIR